MISYRDRAYCSAYDVDCRNGKCDRAVTQEVYAAAKKWWDNPHFETPIAYMDMSVGCKDKIELCDASTKR